jgi:hypothetical protein
MGRRKQKKQGKNRKKHTAEQKPGNRGVGEGVASSPDYYRILGIARGASVELVRKAYLDGIRRYSPESEPERFQQLREAYDVLSDAAGRRRYDQERRYGVPLDVVLDEARRLLDEGKWRLARNQARLAHSIDSRSVEAVMIQAEAEENGGDPAAAWTAVQRALDLSASEDAAIRLAVRWAGWALDPYEGFERLDTVVSRYPDHGPAAVARYRFQAYASLDKVTQGHKVFEKLLDARRPLSSAMLHLYLEWLDESALEGSAQRAVERLRTHVRRGFRPDVDREGFKQVVLNVAREAASQPDYMKQVLYLDVARVLDPADRRLIPAILHARDAAVLQMEIGLLYHDEKIPAPVRTEAWTEYCRFTGWSVDRPPPNSFGFIGGLISQNRGGFGDLQSPAGRLETLYPQVVQMFPTILKTLQLEEPRRKARPAPVAPRLPDERQLLLFGDEDPGGEEK